MINTHVMRSKPSQPPPTQPIANSLSTGTAAKYQYQQAKTKLQTLASPPLNVKMPLNHGSKIHIGKAFYKGSAPSLDKSPLSAAN